jgi:cobaltochelatase CobT
MTTVRRLDRIASAGLRAVAAEPKAEIRGRRLEVDDQPYLVVVPYLSMAGPDVGSDVADEPEALSVRRGVMDGLGLRIRHSDRELHHELSPRPILQRIIFDIAEQFRCESLAGNALPGVRANTTAAFEQWSTAAMGARVGETGVGLLVFTITHMLRARLLRVPTSEAVDEVIEVTRGNLGRLVGHALKELPRTAHSQTEFAVPAAEIARLVAEMVEDAETSADEVPESVTNNALLIPIDWDLLDELEANNSTDGLSAAPDERYHAFTTAHDTLRTGDQLYRQPLLRRMRTELDGHVAAQAVSVARLAQRLQRLFPVQVSDGWSGGEEDGLLDPARLGQLIADPTNRLIHRRERFRPSSDASVTFLVDTSGSMKIQRYESVAVLVDTLTRALEMAGSTSEVLGFTTGAWGGGKVFADWRAAGSPPDPGRLNEVQHIVYKNAEQPWRQARLGLAAMLRTDHYREGVDGEAIEWAHSRLIQRPERRKALVVISDGAPMDAATAGNNRDGFLGDHLRSVARRIEREGAVDLAAIGIDQQLDDYIANSISLDLTGTISIGTYDVLHRLFGGES